MGIRSGSSATIEQGHQDILTRDLWFLFHGDAETEGERFDMGFQEVTVAGEPGFEPRQTESESSCFNSRGACTAVVYRFFSSLAGSFAGSVFEDFANARLRSRTKSG